MNKCHQQLCLCIIMCCEGQSHSNDDDMTTHQRNIHSVECVVPTLSPYLGMYVAVCRGSCPFHHRVQPPTTNATTTAFLLNPDWPSNRCHRRKIDKSPRSPKEFVTELLFLLVVLLLSFQMSTDRNHIPAV